MKPELQRKFAVVMVLSLLVAAGGGTLIFLGLQEHRANEAFRESAWSEDGTVVGVTYESGKGGETKKARLYSVVQFDLDSGEEIQFRGPAQNGIIDLREGDEVRVLYNPADPTDARVDSFLGLWFRPVVFWVVGALIIVIPVLTIRETWRWAEQHTERRLPEVNRLPWQR